MMFNFGINRSGASNGVIVLNVSVSPSLDIEVRGSQSETVAIANSIRDALSRSDISAPSVGAKTFFACTATIGVIAHIGSGSNVCNAYCMPVSEYMAIKRDVDNGKRVIRTDWFFLRIIDYREGLL